MAFSPNIILFLKLLLKVVGISIFYEALQSFAGSIRVHSLYYTFYSVDVFYVSEF